MRANKKTCKVAIYFNSSPHAMQDFAKGKGSLTT